MENTILTADKSSAPSPLIPPSRIVCHVCQKQFSQYTCPRCNCRYCSLPCYKSHSVRCTESFMRENVVEELRGMQPDEEARRKMLDILKRFHSEEEQDGLYDSDDDDDDDKDNADSVLSEDTVQKILSGGSVNFEDLSPKVRKQFQRTVASGELSRLIQPWDPWWLRPSARAISLSKDGTQLVQPLSEHEPSSLSSIDSARIQSSEIPHGPENPLPPVRKLISTEPSPLLAIHLVDIIYSYCFTLRLYNGDWPSDAVGSVMMVLGISSVLGLGGQPETVPEAISHCLERTCSPEFRHMGGPQFGFAIIDDATHLLSLGGPALICMLSDMQRLFQAAERELKAERRKRSGSSEVRNKLKLAERKVYFTMCWVHEQPREAWPSLATVVGAEKSAAMEYTVNKHTVKSEKKPDPGKVIIEEMG